MSATHHYSLANDFPNGLNQVNLTEEIADDENFSAGVQPMVSLVVTGDDIAVTMSAVLQPNDISRFTAIKTSHDHRPSLWKTISTTFPQGLLLSRLTQDLAAVLNIYVGAIGYDSRDRLKLVFTVVPNSAQEIIVDNVCAAHIPYMDPPRTTQINLPIRNAPILNTYSLVSRFQFQINNGVLDYVDLISYTNMSSGRYQFKIVRADDKTLIGESEVFSNTTLQVNTIKTFVNVPTDYSVLEIYVRRAPLDLLSVVTIDQIALWYHTS